MASRVIQDRKLRKVSIGDMRDRVSLERRSRQAPVFGSASATMGYSQIAEVWAKVETVYHGRVFDGVSIENIPSHKFTIRYRDDITTETRIRYNDILYKIVKFDNFEMRNEYLELYARIDGDDEKEASQ